MFAQRLVASRAGAPRRCGRGTSSLLRQSDPRRHFDVVDLGRERPCGFRVRVYASNDDARPSAKHALAPGGALAARAWRRAPGRGRRGGTEGPLVRPPARPAVVGLVVGDRAAPQSGSPIEPVRAHVADDVRPQEPLRSSASVPRFHPMRGRALDARGELVSVGLLPPRQRRPSGASAGDSRPQERSSRSAAAWLASSATLQILRAAPSYAAWSRSSHRTPSNRSQHLDQLVVAELERCRGQEQHPVEDAAELAACQRLGPPRAPPRWRTARRVGCIGSSCGAPRPGSAAADPGRAAAGPVATPRHFVVSALDARQARVDVRAGVQRKVLVQDPAQSAQVRRGKASSTASGTGSSSVDAVLSSTSRSASSRGVRERSRCPPRRAAAYGAPGSHDRPIAGTLALATKLRRAQRALNDREPHQRISTVRAQRTVGQEDQVLAARGRVVEQLQELGPRGDRVIRRPHRRAGREAAGELLPLQRPLAADRGRHHHHDRVLAGRSPPGRTPPRRGPRTSCPSRPRRRGSAPGWLSKSAQDLLCGLRLGVARLCGLICGLREIDSLGQVPLQRAALANASRT